MCTSWKQKKVLSTVRCYPLPPTAFSCHPRKNIKKYTTPGIEVASIYMMQMKEKASESRSGLSPTAASHLPMFRAN